MMRTSQGGHEPEVLYNDCFVGCRRCGRIVGAHMGGDPPGAPRRELETSEQMIDQLDQRPCEPKEYCGEKNPMMPGLWCTLTKDHMVPGLVGQNHGTGWETGRI